MTVLDIPSKYFIFILTNTSSIISPVRSCTFRASGLSEKDAWVSALKQAVVDHHNRRATFTNTGITFDTNGKAEAGALGDSAPIWVPDQRVTMCQKCHTDFTLLVRRHHCRACGMVICSLCSANKAPLKYRAYNACRVCDSCFDHLFSSKLRLFCINLILVRAISRN